MYCHILWVLETKPGKVTHRLGLRSREEQCLTVRREVVYNGIHSLLKPKVQYAVGLVQHQDLQGNRGSHTMSHGKVTN